MTELVASPPWGPRRTGTTRVGRLTSANLGGSYGTHSYQYDTFGNLTMYNGFTRTTSHTTNRLDAAGYDGAGDLETWGIVGFGTETLHFGTTRSAR